MGRGSGREALRRARRVRGVTRAAFGRRGQTRGSVPQSCRTTPLVAPPRPLAHARRPRARRRRHVAIAAAVL